jgi:hypothetical protein
MVQSLDCGYPSREMGIVFLDVFGELVFCARGSNDENRASLRYRLGYMLVELMVGRRVARIARIGLVMQMLVRVSAADGLPIMLIGIEIKDLRFSVIDPNHGVKVLAHSRGLYHSTEGSAGMRASGSSRWPGHRLAGHRRRPGVRA